MFKQIRVHYARMHHIHLHVRLLCIQQTLQVASEENLCQLGLTVRGARVVVLAARRRRRRRIIHMSKEIPYW